MTGFDPFADAGHGRVTSSSLKRSERTEDVPTVAELGRRFAALRADTGLTLEAVSRISDSDRMAIVRFEEHGEASADLLLLLVRHFSSSAGFTDAFRAPKFRTIDDVVSHRMRKRRA